MKYKKHKHGRGSGSFESHIARDRDVGNRKGRAWRFFDIDRVFYLENEPHFRTTTRRQDLTGRHIRSVVEPVRAAHGRLP